MWAGDPQVQNAWWVFFLCGMRAIAWFSLLRGARWGSGRASLDFRLQGDALSLWWKWSHRLFRAVNESLMKRLHGVWWFLPGWRSEGALRWGDATWHDGQSVKMNSSIFSSRLLDWLLVMSYS
jgi:hypothetical protein